MTVAGKSTEGSGNSSYAAGGGGVTLEQTVGGVLLTCLLLRLPTIGLGESEAVERIALQASGTSPVDDFVVHGTERRISFGVRRNPTIAAGDTKFVTLLIDYLRITIDHSAEVDQDKWRLGLVVASPHTGATETRSLADFARAHHTATSFRAEVLREGATTAYVRARLKHIDDAVASALVQGKLQAPDNDKDALTWRFLRALRVVISRLEGDDAEDRSNAIARLVDATRGPAEAEKLFYDLCRLTGRLATRAGVIDMQTLRRELRGVAEVNPAAAYAKAWSVFTTCSDLLNGRTPTALADPSVPTGSLTIERTELRTALSAALRKAGEDSTCLIVSGEPDVGKSVLTLMETTALKASGASIISVSFRDLPPTPLALDQYLGAPAERVFGAMAVAPIRMLFLDGAEVVLEGRGDLVSYVLRAAQRAGVAVALTTRDDAKGVLAQAAKQAGLLAQEFAVPPLIEDEINQVAGTFPVLSRVATEPRSRWLLARPGLVELVLQSGAHAALPDGALSEADVFAAVWRFLVRLDEITAPNAATPDGRDAALVGVIRKMLEPATTIVNTDTLAIPSLRRDRILLPLGPTAAWQTGESFASDLYRDLATARLLVIDDLQATIASANAPRWLVRAARLATQVRLARAGVKVETTRQTLQAAFEQVAQTHGERWRDVVWEALLTLGTSRDALKGAAKQLLANDGRELRDLLRVVLQKFCRTDQADAVIVAPVVEFICDYREAIASLERSLRDQVQQVATYWLAGRGFEDRRPISDTLRIRVRDELLRNAREESAFRVYGLSLLGPDLDQVGVNELRAVEPDMLQPSVEGLYSRRILARHQPELLLELAERYYVELPDPDEPRYRTSFLDDGVRRHEGTGGFYSPNAAFYFGPFWVLLNSKAASATVPFIKRLVDHATRVRVTRGIGRDVASIPSHQLPGLEWNLPRLGARRFIGDAHIWRWYRATGVGPHPCMSALLALERALDQQLADPELPLADVVDLLLRDCDSLAMPGLAVGILIRYIERVNDELDVWLTNPHIWDLEADRALSEQHGVRHAWDSDIEQSHGHKLRKWMLHDIVGLLVAEAYTRGDAARLDTLAELGRNLVANASAMVTGALAEVTVNNDGARDSGDLDTASDNNADAPGSSTTETQTNQEAAEAVPELDESELSVRQLVRPEAQAREARQFLLRVRRWGAMFDVANYQSTAKVDRVELAFIAPAEIQEELLPRLRDHLRGQSAWSLVAKYSMRDDAPASTDTLLSDIALVRDLEANPPDMGPPQEMRVSAAVASAAIDASTLGASMLSPVDLGWAVDTVIRVASPSGDDALESARSLFSSGPNRLAARSIAQVLGMPSPVVTDQQYERALGAVRGLASSRIDEVRVVFADSLRGFWRSPCRAFGGRCSHAIVLDAFREALTAGRFVVDKFTGPQPGPPIDDPTSQLPSIPAHELILECLLAPIIATTDCAVAGNCASATAVALRLALLDAHRRTIADNAKRKFDLNDSPGVLAVPRALLTINDGELEKHATFLVDQARALDSLLRGLATVATVDRDMRTALAQVWPRFMDLLLDLVGGGHDLRGDRYYGRRAFAALVPRPNPPRGATNIDALVHAAADGWPSLTSITEQMHRWVPLAAGHPESVDALVGFLEAQPTTTQLQPSLELMMTLTAADFAAIANRAHFLPSWLERVREHALREQASRKTYHRLIDGLAAANDGVARRLQNSLE